MLDFITFWKFITKRVVTLLQKSDTGSPQKQYMFLVISMNNLQQNEFYHCGTRFFLLSRFLFLGLKNKPLSTDIMSCATYRNNADVFPQASRFAWLLQIKSFDYAGYRNFFESDFPVLERGTSGL